MLFQDLRDLPMDSGGIEKFHEKFHFVISYSVYKVTREALLTHGHNGIRPRNVKYDRASVRQQASDVTDNLTAVSRMLAEEVRKSERTLESLALSSNS